MFELIFIAPSPLFIFNSPQEWLLVAAAVFLPFGANKLPELAKSLGQTRKAFKAGMREAEEEEERVETAKNNLAQPDAKPSVAEIDDAALLEEIRRRKEQTNRLESGRPSIL